MRLVWLVAALAAAAVPGAPARAEPFGYRAAVAAFDRDLTLPERMRLQVRLVAGGYTNGVPTPHLGLRAFEAIRAFQAEAGFEPTGRFTVPAAARLRDDTQERMAEWGFAWVEHPTRSVRLWAPLGLGLVASDVPRGTHYEDGQGRLLLDVLSYPASDARFAYQSSLADWRRRGWSVHYSVFKDGEGRDGGGWWVA